MSTQILSIMRANIHFAGILKCKNPKMVSAVNEVVLPDGQIRLPDDKIHMTLVHQSLLKPKPIKAAMKDSMGRGMKVPWFDLVLEPVIREGWYRNPNDPSKDEFRSGLAFLVTPESQERLTSWSRQLLANIGVLPENFEDRTFHVSISNLTGNPGSSLR